MQYKILGAIGMPRVYPAARFLSWYTLVSMQYLTARRCNRCTACKTDKDLYTRNIFYETLF